MNASRRPVNPCLQTRVTFVSMYSQLMMIDIAMCKDLAVDGVVTGVLLPNGDVDAMKLKDIIRISTPLKV